MYNNYFLCFSLVCLLYWNLTITVFFLGDELLSDSFVCKEIENGMLWEVDGKKQELFKKHIEGATKFLLSKLKDLQFFVGESMHDDGSMVFAYYKDGAVDPTFIYFAYGLKEVKC
ncbi:hypothetical protein B296_00004736 [Ensete ventricosum]|uniref:TCTP domain-containing protein n=1 Tax=Ensete ventricosum TaxID=4639 RepID=A0A427AFD1_ENSVE|nr:hypothetical protein B296_00004736 [Ensete ventricosum]